MSGLLNILQMLYRSLTGYEQRQREKALKARLWSEISAPRSTMNIPAGVETDLTEER